MNITRICILGGTGFIGSHLTGRLIRDGFQVRIPTRNRERHRDLLVMPSVKLVSADIHDPSTLREQVSDCQAVINLVGILHGSAQAFEKAHARLPAMVAEACQQAGVERLLHMCAINADAEQGTSEYLRSKGRGEDAVMATHGPQLAVTSFRPSVVFGPDDSFLNTFANLLKISPFFPVACPQARFAPVFVGNVVEAFVKSLNDPTTFGQRYELCGPEVYTFQELVQTVARLARRRRWIMPLSNQLSRWQAQIMDKIPGAPMSWDNYLSMQMDSVCQENGLVKLGIEAHSIDAVMANHLAGRDNPLGAFRKAGRG